ncbi:MAG: hypothetical protein ACKO96_41680, partial [Flammeovirgaceae bacterium]
FLEKKVDYTLAFDILIGVVCSLLGWILRVVWDAQPKLARDIQEIELRLGEDFVRREDHHRALDQLMARFDRLESRLEHYFNSRGGH